MNIKDIKSEARQKLPINMHQAIVVYTIEYAIFITIIALISVASMLFGAVSAPAAIVIVCYGVVLGILALTLGGIVNYALVDYYLASYKCTPYNVRRLADTVARNGISKILLLNLIRTLLGILLTALLIVPGVFYLSRTAVANYLLNANPKLKPTTVLAASGKVMSGKLGTYLALQFSMLGWYVLGVVTLGIGFIWISPYLNLTKAVYYKRCLQGDKQVYSIPVQPVQATPYPQQQQQMPQYPQQAQMREQPQAGAVAQPAARPVAQDPSMQEPARPIHIDPPVPPIATLGDSDVMDMNAAINDFGGEAIAPSSQQSTPVSSEVPEVPISSPSAKRKTRTITGASDGGSSDIDIQERTLSTQEVDESHVYEKRVDALYSHSNPRSDERPHNYMEENGTQNANDFVTMEYQDGDGPQSAHTASVAPDAAASDSVMSDEDFAEFIRNFDVPVPGGVGFTPLKQNKTHEPAAVKPSAAEPVSTPKPAATATRQTPQTPTASSAATRQTPQTPSESTRPTQASPNPTRPTQQTPTSSAAARPSAAARQMRTAEQVRAEREERLRNLRRK